MGHPQVGGRIDSLKLVGIWVGYRAFKKILIIDFTQGYKLCILILKLIFTF
jgi:hypothetical protein